MKTFNPGDTVWFWQDADYSDRTGGPVEATVTGRLGLSNTYTVIHTNTSVTARVQSSRLVTTREDTIRWQIKRLKRRQQARQKKIEQLEYEIGSMHREIEGLQRQLRDSQHAHAR